MARKRRIYLFGGSFNPPGKHHESVLLALKEICRSEDEIVIVPCGARPDKECVNDMDHTHRTAMVELAFGGMPGVHIDFLDLEREEFTCTWDLDARYRELFPDADIWHVVGMDLVKGGASGQSEIQSWNNGSELFRHRPFVVVTRAGYETNQADFPPNHVLIDPTFSGSSSTIRSLCAQRAPISDLVDPLVARYIKRWHLYTGRQTLGIVDWTAMGSGIVLADASTHTSVERQQRIEALKKLAERVYATRKKEQDHILVIGGDGFMLDAIAEHAHRRLPFIGLNAGTVGFLLNDGSPEVLEACLCQGRCRLYQQRLLRVQWSDPWHGVHQALTFNEVFLRATADQAAWMKVKINGDVRFDRLVGDGLMVSTPAGSTGWAYAMGATPVMIGTPQVILTGCATIANRRRFVSAPLPEQATIEVEVLNHDKRPMRLVQSGHTMGEFRRAAIQLSRAHAVELGFFPETDLAQKLMDLNFQQ